MDASSEIEEPKVAEEATPSSTKEEEEEVVVVEEQKQPQVQEEEEEKTQQLSDDQAAVEEVDADAVMETNKVEEEEEEETPGLREKEQVEEEEQQQQQPKEEEKEEEQQPINRVDDEGANLDINESKKEHEIEAVVDERAKSAASTVLNHARDSLQTPSSFSIMATSIVESTSSVQLNADQKKVTALIQQHSPSIPRKLLTPLKKPIPHTQYMEPVGIVPDQRSKKTRIHAVFGRTTFGHSRRFKDDENNIEKLPRPITAPHPRLLVGLPRGNPADVIERCALRTPNPRLSPRPSPQKYNIDSGYRVSRAKTPSALFGTSSKEKTTFNMDYDHAYPRKIDVGGRPTSPGPIYDTRNSDSPKKNGIKFATSLRSKPSDWSSCGYRKGNQSFHNWDVEMKVRDRTPVPMFGSVISLT